MPDRPPVLSAATRQQITMNPAAFNATLRECQTLREQNANALAELRHASCQITSLGGNAESIDKLISAMELSA